MLHNLPTLDDDFENSFLFQAHTQVEPSIRIKIILFVKVQSTEKTP